MTLEQDVNKAIILLERYLVEKHPDYRTLNLAQAQEIFSMRAFDIWSAWMLLNQKEG